MNLPEAFEQRPGSLVVEARLICGGCGMVKTYHDLQVPGTVPTVYAEDSKRFFSCDLQRPLWSDDHPWYDIPHFGFYCLPCAKKLHAGMVAAVAELRAKVVETINNPGSATHGLLLKAPGRDIFGGPGA